MLTCFKYCQYVKHSDFMAQIFDPLPPESLGKVLCCYLNATNKIQVARITNIPNWYFERVVFPGQRLIFETLSEAQLEIHTGMMASAILSDTISCKRLRIQDPTATDQTFSETRISKEPDLVGSATIAAAAGVE